MWIKRPHTLQPLRLSDANASIEKEKAIMNEPPTTAGSAPGPTLLDRIDTWLTIATRQADSPDGYKLYPGDFSALASVLRECKRHANS